MGETIESKKGYNLGVKSDGVGVNYLTQIKEEITSIEEDGFRVMPKPDGKGYLIIRRTKGKTIIVDKTTSGLLKDDQYCKILIDDGGSVTVNGKEL